MILSVIDRIYGEQSNKSNKLKLPKWVKVKKIQYNKKTVQNAKNNSWQARPNWSRLLTLNVSNKLLQDIEHSKITYEEALKKMTNISNDIKMLEKLDSLTQNKSRVLNTLFMVDEIYWNI